MSDSNGNGQLALIDNRLMEEVEKTVAVINSFSESLDNLSQSFSGLLSDIGEGFSTIVSSFSEAVEVFNSIGESTSVDLPTIICECNCCCGGGAVNDTYGPFDGGSGGGDTPPVIPPGGGEWIQEIGVAFTSIIENAGPVIQSMTEFILAFEKMQLTIGLTDLALTGLKAGIIAYDIITSGSAVGIGIVTAAQWAWNAAMTANPIGIIIVAVGALIAAIGLLAYYWDDVVEFLAEKFQALWEGIKAGCQWLVDVALKIWEGWSNIFIGIWEIIKAVALAVWDAIVAACEWLIDILVQSWQGWCIIFSAVWDMIKTVALVVWDAIKDAALALVDYILEKWEEWQEIFEIVWTYIQDLWDEGCAVIQEAWQVICDFFNDTWDAIKELWDSCMEFLSGVWDNLCEGIKVGWDIIVGWFSSTIDRFREIAGNIGGVFMDTFESVRDFVTGVIESIMEKIAGVFSAIKDLGGKAMGLLRKINPFSRSNDEGEEESTEGLAPLPGLATGGFTRGLSYAGENGMEAVISFDPRYRSQNREYLMTASDMLGMSGSAVNVDNTSNAVVYDMGGITFSPVINASGNADTESILDQLRSVLPDFMDLIEEEMHNRERSIYA